MRICGMLRIAVCAGMVLFQGVGQMGHTSASAAATRPVEPPVELVCTVSSLPKGSGELTSEAICTSFLRRIREALSVPVTQTGSLPAGDRGRWVKLDVRLSPRGRAEAALTSRLHDKATSHPILAVQVMDKSLGLSEIDRLARLVGKTLVGP